MKNKENFGCTVHHRVFFSRKEIEKHIKEKCHPENIVRLKGEDFLGRMLYNIVSEAIEASNLIEKEKEELLQAYLW